MKVTNCRWTSAVVFVMTTSTGWAQDITADNVKDVVAFRTQIMMDSPVGIDGTDFEIQETGLNGEDGSHVYLMMRTDAGVFGFDMAAIFENGEPAEMTDIIWRETATESSTGADFSGTAEVVDFDTPDGLDFQIKVAGSVQSDAGETRNMTTTVNDVIFSMGSTNIASTDDALVLTGTLGWKSYAIMADAIAANPDVSVLQLQQSDGSVDDAINMHTARLVRAAGLTTFVPADGEIASGAVDMFAAGVDRIVEPGAKLGVHSWCCSEDGTPVTELPRDHPEHAAQLAYFTEMLGPKQGPEFYFFTLNAAPAEEIKIMTAEEWTSTGLVTEIR